MLVDAKHLGRTILLILVLVFTTCAKKTIASDYQLISRHGKGALFDKDGTRVLFVSGSPYQMGYQHGRLLKNHISEMVEY